MIDHEAHLRKAAAEIRAQNINGWGNTCEAAADHIAALEAMVRELLAVHEAHHNHPSHAAARRLVAPLVPERTTP